MKLSSLSIVIPAFNDELTIETVVSEADEVAKSVAKVYEVWVVEDGSSDGTREVLESLSKKYKHLHVCFHDTNQGYGTTIKELYMKGKYEWIFSVPGDYQVGAKELLTLLPHTKEADCIVGWRVARHDPPSRLVQSAFYNGLIRILFGLPIHDINSVRVMRRSIVQALGLLSESAFVDAELTIKAAKKGYTVMEIPISHRSRVGSVGGGGKWWTILPTIWEMVRFWVRVRFYDK